MKVRALLVAMVVALAAAGGALYLAHRMGGTLQSAPAIDLRVATNGTLADILGGSPDDAQLIGVALQQLEQQYYKPINPQTPFQAKRRHCSRI